jgi:hypothetical protein
MKRILKYVFSSIALILFLAMLFNPTIKAENITVLTTEDISQIEEIKQDLDNDNEALALQEVIDYVKKNGNIKTEELETMLDSFGIKRLSLYGKVDDLPDKVKIIMTGTWIPADSTNLLSGEVNKKIAPPTKHVQWKLFLGYYNVYDLAPRIFMGGFAFGLSIDGSVEKDLHTNRGFIIKDWIKMLWNAFDRLFERLIHIIPINLPTQ